jgi:Tfp pilus assembly protein PilE
LQQFPGRLRRPGKRVFVEQHMTKYVRSEDGDTLVEIISAVVVIGLVVSAFFASFTTATRASSTHRDLVTADAVLRNYAEAIKGAARDTVNGCGKASPTTFTASYAPPAGFTVAANPSVSAQTCPAVNSTQVELLTVTLPNGKTKSLTIEVRTP